MNLQMLALAFLAATAVGGVAWVFVYPLLSGEKKAEARRLSVAKPEPAARRADAKNQRSRREQVEGSLKELEARRAKDAKVSLATRLTQAGLGWSEQKFWIISGIWVWPPLPAPSSPAVACSAPSASPLPRALACRAGS